MFSVTSASDVTRRLALPSCAPRSLRTAHTVAEISSTDNAAAALRSPGVGPTSARRRPDGGGGAGCRRGAVNKPPLTTLRTRARDGRWQA